MSDKPIGDVIKGVYNLLEPLETEKRRKIIRALPALLLDSNDDSESDSTDVSDASTFGAEAEQWMTNVGVTLEHIHRFFHKIDTGDYVLMKYIPGKGSAGKTRVVYLLKGVENLLNRDTPAIEDADARGFCEQIGCYDAANHSSNLKKLDKELIGNKKIGYQLTVYGLEAAAEIIKGTDS